MANSTFLAGLFDVSAFLLFWTYLGYPIALALLTRRATPLEGSSDRDLPSLTVIVPCYNESRSIQTKLRNLDLLDYPKDRIEVIVADDGSQDDTIAKARAFLPPVRVLGGPRLGKARTINRVLPETHGEIIVVSDANATVDSAALRRVVAPFSDPQVGATTGDVLQRNRSGTAVAEGGETYWRMEQLLRSRESQLHSVIGLSGKLSAIRRALLILPNNTVTNWFAQGSAEDFEMALWAIRKGYRVKYVSNAHVYDNAPDTLQDLFRQKVRIITQTIVSVRANLSAVHRGWYGFIFISRKVLPLFSPLFTLIVILVPVVFAARSPYWFVLALIELLTLAVGLLGFYPKVQLAGVRLLHFFILLNATVVVGWYQSLRARDYSTWQPVSSPRHMLDP